MRFRSLIVTVLFNYVRCYIVKEGIFNISVPKAVNSDPLPEYFDWREQNAVSPVKDQRSCGACWAFSAVANIESHIKIYLQKEVKLSEQFLIDCEVSGTGCQTTTVLKIFAQIVSIFGGVLLDEDYRPYSDQALECKWNGRNPRPVPVIGFRRVKPDETVMVDYLYRYGPLSAAINSASMHHYQPGTIDEPTDAICPPNKLDHAVLIVGYNAHIDKNTGKATPYWIIKNSWGSEWGDRGYYYLVRGRNACGIASDVSFSIVK